MGARTGLGDDIVRIQAAYAHVLRTALRGQSPPPQLARYCHGDRLARVTASTTGPTRC